eukprot:gb/GFBE01064229.1/.p1 GENE.gb/GFBE01064229.1/~~gb/GFBE01064229.1/.p1  ORF type:complete len:296 (+),score=43.70 gb/GFBE01064229.1/:1-888(+)
MMVSVTHTGAIATWAASSGRVESLHEPVIIRSLHVGQRCRQTSRSIRSYCCHCMALVPAVAWRRRRYRPTALRATDSQVEVPVQSQTREEKAASVAKKFMVLETTLGEIWLRFRPDSAPISVEHVCRIVQDGLYDGCYFYRSDFVLQWGLWLPDESEVRNPYDEIPENETNTGKFISNRRGTVSIAHGIGQNGNSDLYINLQDNDYLDTMSFGFCVWAEVVDESSLEVVDQLAAAVVEGEKPVIVQASLTNKFGRRADTFPMVDLMRSSYDRFLKSAEALPPPPNLARMNDSLDD